MRTALLGLVIVPAVALLAFGALVVGSEAFLGPNQPGLGPALLTAMLDQGWLPTPMVPTAPAGPSATASPVPTVTESSFTGFVQDPARPLRFTLTPTATASPTAIPSETPTETPTATASETPTPTATASPTASLTPTWPPTSTPTRTLTPLPSSTPVPTATAPPTSTQPSVSDPSGTPQVSNTPDGSSPTATASQTAAPTATPTASGDCSTSLNISYEQQIMDLVNEARAANGRSAYRVQSQLQAAARVHAADMACNHFTGHTGSDGSSVRDRVEAQGYSWSWIGENFMVTRNGPQAAFDWWMNSTPHRNNILSPNYTEFGVGYIYGPDSDYGGYYVIVFARPG